MGEKLIRLGGDVSGCGIDHREALPDHVLGIVSKK